MNIHWEDIAIKVFASRISRYDFLDLDDDQIITEIQLACDLGDAMAKEMIAYAQSQAAKQKDG